RHQRGRGAAHPERARHLGHDVDGRGGAGRGVAGAGGAGMSVLIGKNTKVVVQGITGRDGSFHTKGMLDYGTRVVAGVTPARAGSEVHGVPVFAGVAE